MDMSVRISEELITSITTKVLQQLNQTTLEVPVGVSARHLHLSRGDVDTLFGIGYEVNKKADLMGGQYACQESVTIVGANLRAIENVRILAPLRNVSQVEVSKTDAVRLGISAPVRDSGDLKDAAAITIVGPKGAVYLPHGCIIAKRHIHMSVADAQHFGVQDKERVSVKFDNERSGILDQVLIRVDQTFTLEMHLDTDEANGLGLKTGSIGRMIKNGVGQ